MDHTYWHKQTKEPLYPDLVWSRPENRTQAGKLLIIGGNAHGFLAVAEAYNASVSAGIGTSRVLLPDAIAKAVKAILDTADYAPSTPSGSFATKALAELLDHAAWADGVLLAGDLGRNSETAILLEKFVTKYNGPLTLTKDAVDYFTSNPQPLVDRKGTTLVPSIAQLQKFATSAHSTSPITFAMNLLQLIDWLHEFTSTHEVCIVTKHLETMFVAVDGQVSTTKTEADIEDAWRVTIAAHCAVWQLQNLSKQFEALTTALHQEK